MPCAHIRRVCYVVSDHRNNGKCQRVYMHITHEEFFDTLHSFNQVENTIDMLKKLIIKKNINPDQLEKLIEDLTDS